MKVVTPKDFFTSPLGKLILLVLIMVGCWCVLCIYLSANSAGGTWLPTDTQMNRALKDINTERVKYNDASKEMAEIEKLRAKYNTKLATFWQVERDGTPETELRTLILDTAAVLDITMTRLDNVRISSKITDELYYADLSFQFTDTYDKVVAFISQIESTQPRLGWRTLTINAENNRNRNNNNLLMGGNARIVQTTSSGSSSGTTTTVQQKYRLDATVRVIRYMPVADPNASANAAAGKAQGQTGTAATAAQGAAAQTSQLQPPPAQQGAAAQPAQGAAGATAAIGAVGDPTQGKPPVQPGTNAGVTPGAAPDANAALVRPVNQGPQGQMQPGMGMQGGMGGMDMGGFGGGMGMQGGFGNMQGGFGGGMGGMGMQGGFGNMQGGFGGMDMGGFGGGMGMQPGMQGGNMQMQQGGRPNMQQGGNMQMQQGGRPANNAQQQNQRPANNAGAANNVAPAAQAQQGAARRN